MNRIQRDRLRAPWAWMQTGPLTVDVEARMSNPDPERPVAEAAEPIPTSIHTEAVERPAVGAERAESQLPQRQGTAFHPELRRVAVPQNTEYSGVSTPEAIATEDTKLTLDDFPSLKAAMESFEKRGDPIMIPVDTEPSSTQRVYTEGDLPERAPNRRSKAKLRKSRSKKIVKRVNLRPAIPRKQSRPKSQTEIDESHHERRCTICRHPERETIEEAFLQWRNVQFIARDFNITGGRSAIYRHARALKLFKQRNLCLRSSLEFVIEQSERIMPTAEGLVKAIRAYTRINDAGEWIDTPTTHIIQVMPMPTSDPRNVASSVPGLTLNVRKHPSDVIESPTPQPFLTGTAPQTEIDVTD